MIWTRHVMLGLKNKLYDMWIQYEIRGLGLRGLTCLIKWIGLWLTYIIWSLYFDMTRTRYANTNCYIYIECPTRATCSGISKVSIWAKPSRSRYNLGVHYSFFHFLCPLLGPKLGSIIIVSQPQIINQPIWKAHRSHQNCDLYKLDNRNFRRRIFLLFSDL